MGGGSGFGFAGAAGDQGFEFGLGDIQFEEFLLVGQAYFGGGALGVEQVNEAELALLEAGLDQPQGVIGLGEDPLTVFGGLVGGGLKTLARGAPVAVPGLTAAK